MAFYRNWCLVQLQEEEKRWKEKRSAVTVQAGKSERRVIMYHLSKPFTGIITIH